MQICVSLLKINSLRAVLQRRKTNDLPNAKVFIMKSVSLDAAPHLHRKGCLSIGDSAKMIRIDRETLHRLY